MILSAATIWWVLAGILVAVELGTGTFYLLMIAVGLAAGALAAHLGLSISAQVATAAIVGGGATALWHWRRYRNPRSEPASSNRDVNLDVGAHVLVQEWAADRTTRVTYRGSGWPARLAPGATPMIGQHEVVAVEGNWLVLSPLDLPARN
jgi:membrane protein implicated in regulation of membrane protease activity